MTQIRLNPVDWVVLAIYLCAVFGFGIYMSRREKTEADFFLAGRSLPWYAIALSLFATNISSGSIVGLAGDGYRVGLAVGTLEWGALLGLFLLAFVFVPYYQKSRVFTMPEFMERRYDVYVRILFAISVLIFEILVNIPFLLYAGGLAVKVLFGVSYGWALVAIAAFVGVYTTFGGLSAVVWTDVIQGCFMIVGGATVTFFGLRAIGGFGMLSSQAADKMHVCLPASHPEYPFPATMIGGYFLVTIYYWCQNQTMVQRALGARTEWDARMGAMVACFIKLFLPFIIVLPGIVAFLLFPNLDPADQALPQLIRSVIPSGLIGLIIAAVIASLMSSADSALNSWATLFTHDIYYRLLNRRASSGQLLLVGRLAIAFVLTATVVRTLLLRDTSSILQFLLNGLAYISCPIIIIFMLGVFWKKATAAAAIVTMIVSPAVCYFSQNMRNLTGLGPEQISIVYWLPIAVGICTTVAVIASLATTPKSASELEGLLWKKEDTLRFSTDLFERQDIEKGETHVRSCVKLSVWKDYRLVGVLAMLLMVIVIWIYR